MNCGFSEHKSCIFTENKLQKGLIVNLALPPNPRPRSSDFNKLIFHLVNKVDALLIDPGFWVPSLPVDEYITHFIESCFGYIPEKLPVFLLITGSHAEKTRENIRAVRNSLDNISRERPVYLVDVPLMYHSNRGLPAFYSDVLSDVDLPMIVMNDSDRVEKARPFYKRKNLRTSVVKKLAAIPNICALINRSDLQRALNYSKAIQHHSEFPMYDNDEGFFLSNPSTSGLVSISANLFPSAWKMITRFSLGQDDDVMSLPEKVQERWAIGQRLQQMVNQPSNRSPEFIRQVLYHWKILKPDRCQLPEPAETSAEALSTSEALHFVRHYPEPDKIDPC